MLLTPSLIAGLSDLLQQVNTHSLEVVLSLDAPLGASRHVPSFSAIAAYAKLVGSFVVNNRNLPTNTLAISAASSLSLYG